MTQNFKKEIAISLRKEGYSYSSISEQVNIPKSTIVFWLNKLKLSHPEIIKLTNRRRESFISSTHNRLTRNKEKIELISSRAKNEILDVSKKDLWLMGIILYWGQRLSKYKNNDLKHGINFTSSDPNSIVFFLKWLRDIGNISEEDILCDIYIDVRIKHNFSDIIAFWSDITKIDKQHFSRVYYKKAVHNSKKKYEISPYGYFRIRVKNSSLLSRQISGWAMGILTKLNII